MKILFIKTFRFILFECDFEVNQCVVTLPSSAAPCCGSSVFSFHVLEMTLMLHLRVQTAERIRQLLCFRTRLSVFGLTSCFKCTSSHLCRKMSHIKARAPRQDFKLIPSHPQTLLCCSEEARPQVNVPVAVLPVRTRRSALRFGRSRSRRRATV